MASWPNVTAKPSTLVSTRSERCQVAVSATGIIAASAKYFDSNPSSCAVEFDVRLNAMKDAQAENFNFPIFKQYDVESGNENVMIDEVNGNLSLGIYRSRKYSNSPVYISTSEEKEYKLNFQSHIAARMESPGGVAWARVNLQHQMKQYWTLQL